MGVKVVNKVEGVMGRMGEEETKRLRDSEIVKPISFRGNHLVFHPLSVSPPLLFR
jgi:hypothetical protein